jgi:hypothetical protein
MQEGTNTRPGETGPEEGERSAEELEPDTIPTIVNREETSVTFGLKTAVLLYAPGPSLRLCPTINLVRSIFCLYLDLLLLIEDKKPGLRSFPYNDKTVTSYHSLGHKEIA